MIPRLNSKTTDGNKLESGTAEQALSGCGRGLRIGYKQIQASRHIIRYIPYGMIYNPAKELSLVFVHWQEALRPTH